MRFVLTFIGHSHDCIRNVWAIKKLLWGAMEEIYYYHKAALASMRDNLICPTCLFLYLLSQVALPLWNDYTICWTASSKKNWMPRTRVTHGLCEVLYVTCENWVLQVLPSAAELQSDSLTTTAECHWKGGLCENRSVPALPFQWHQFFRGTEWEIWKEASEDTE